MFNMVVNFLSVLLWEVVLSGEIDINISCPIYMVDICVGVSGSSIPMVKVHGNQFLKFTLQPCLLNSYRM